MLSSIPLRKNQVCGLCFKNEEEDENKKKEEEEEEEEEEESSGKINKWKRTDKSARKRSIRLASRTNAIKE